MVEFSRLKGIYTAVCLTGVTLLRTSSSVWKCCMHYWKILLIGFSSFFNFWSNYVFTNPLGSSDVIGGLNLAFHYWGLLSLRIALSSVSYTFCSQICTRAKGWTYQRAAYESWRVWHCHCRTSGNVAVCTLLILSWNFLNIQFISQPQNFSRYLNVFWCCVHCLTSRVLRNTWRGKWRRLRVTLGNYFRILLNLHDKWWQCLCHEQGHWLSNANPWKGHLWSQYWRLQSNDNYMQKSEWGCTH